MKHWVKVNRCPNCGGAIILSEFYTYTLDFRITKKGTISKRYTKSTVGPIDCMTAYCDGCQSSWDATQVCVENNGFVFLRMEERRVKKNG